MAVHLSQDLEARIREKVDAGAAASVDAFVDRVLRQALGLLSEGQTDNPPSSVEIDRDADAFFAAIDADLPSDLPALPDYAVAREAIYEERM